MLLSDGKKTTEWQTFVYLIKGNVGTGCLSLPWAVSQLGIVMGIITTICLSFWTSYNCWTIVVLKRHIMMERSSTQEEEGSRMISNITYAELGYWAYGKRFRTIISSCICTLQLAICTVYMSFIGENLKVVFDRWFVHPISHLWFIVLSLPGIVVLVCGFPSLKALAPITTAATVTLFMGFGLLGVIVVQEWKDRPDELPPFTLPSLPVAVCAILYSLEGICLVLPLESAMLRPANFGKVFVVSMVCVTFIFCLVSSICVVTFGEVTNGSITAFLLQRQEDLEEGALFWILLSNTVCSVSVMLTYPLQLIPCLELLAPWVSRNLLRWNEDTDNDLLTYNPSEQMEHCSNTNYHTMDGDGAKDTAAPVPEPRRHRSTRRRRSSFYSIESSGIPGDSNALRLSLVVFTFLIATVIPNVQSIISLAGAFAGSAVALLIPPLLELAYLHRRTTSSTNHWCVSSLWSSLRCYASLLLGLVCFSIGTIAALMDIVHVYKANKT